MLSSIQQAAAARRARRSESNARRHSVDVSRLQESAGRDPSSPPATAGRARPSLNTLNQNTLQAIASSSAQELPGSESLRGSALRASDHDAAEPAEEEGTMDTAEHDQGLTAEKKSTARPHRFSLLRFRHASDSALNQKAKSQEQAQENVPPVPQLEPTSMQTKKTPKIVMTSPAVEGQASKSADFSTKRSWLSRTSLDRHTGRSSTDTFTSSRPSLHQIRPGGSTSRQASSLRGSTGRVTFEDTLRPLDLIDPPRTSSAPPPPPYDENVNSLHVPGPRLSESSRSTTSSGDHIAFATTTTTTTTTTTFWRIPRRKKNRQSLFPLPPKVEGGLGNIGHGNTASESSEPLRPGSARSLGSGRASPSKRLRPVDGSRSPSVLAASALNFAAPVTPDILRTGSAASFRSEGSPGDTIPSSPHRGRERSATMVSMDQGTSSGRSSLGGFFGLRIRRDSEPGFGGGIARTASPLPGSGLTHAKSVDKHIMPERKDEDTPQSYLTRLENTLSRGVVATILSTSNDPFLGSVLKAYLDTFQFTNDPMDMAIRKLLMEVELPRETQQIDRVLQAFAERYQACNPDIFKNAESAYFIAFSLLILHTDVFNKANRHKMQKQDYIRNTSGEGVGNEILECFYDNITYTPFIHLEDDFDINGEKMVSHHPKKGLFGRSHTDIGRSKEPVDPYTLIIDNRLDWLRPPLKDKLQLDDPFDYIGTARRLDMQELHRSFFRTGVLQIVSERSRPDAFSSPSTVANPEEATPGVVDIKITKVGTLWRKDTKKKRTRSPWQEWGVILTGSQLYFFKNLSWIKGLIEQYEKHQKHDTSGTPVVFKPPLPAFKPDAVLSTDDSVALLDTSYKKHKNAFAFVRSPGSPEVFIADSEEDMNDWMAKINYAATFRTSGIRMRGVIGSHEMQRSRGIRRLDSPSSNRDGLGRKGSVDPQMAMEISAARKQVMEHKMAEADRKLQNDYEHLDSLLRTAKHLLLLTPIQAKAREAVVQAAINLNTKIKWIRMDIWKTKCHRDILHLDLEEERKTILKEIAAKQPQDTAVTVPERPGTAQSDTPTPSLYTTPMGDGKQSLQLSPVKNALDSWELPKFGDESKDKRPESPSSSAGSKDEPPVRPSLDFRASVDTSRSHHTSSPHGSQTSLEETLVQRTSKEMERRPSVKDKQDKSSVLPKKIRNLHKPGQAIYAHISKKSRDFSGDALRTHAEKRESMTEEGLTRATPNFTVHGKKASVINFGSEWNAMSPEERLRKHRSSGIHVRKDGDLERRPSLVPSITETSQDIAVDDAAESIKTVRSGPAELQKMQPLEVPEGPVASATL